LKRLATGAAWGGLASLVSMASTFMVSFAAVQMLGAATFGEFGVLLATAGTCAVFSGSWLSVIATKLISESLAASSLGLRWTVVDLLQATVSLGVLIGMVLLVLAEPIARHLLSADHLANGLRWIAILQVLNAIESVQQGVLTGLEAYRHMMRTNVLRAMMALPLTTSGIHLAGLDGALIGTVLVSLLAVGFNQMAIRNHPVLRRCSDPSALRAPWRLLIDHSDLVVPTFLGALLGAPSIWLLTTFQAAQPGGYLQVGIFTAANQWRNALLFVPRKFSVAALPLMAQVERGTGQLFSMTQSLSILVCMPMVCALAFLAQDLASLYGPDFVGQGGAFIGVLLVAGLSSVGAGAGAAIVSRGRMWLGLFTNVVNTAVLLGSGYLLIPAHGAEGFFMALSLATAANLLVTYALMHKIFGLVTLARAALAVALLGIVMALAYLRVPTAGWLLAPIAGALIALVSYAALIDQRVRSSVRTRILTAFQKISG
jgi:O-antigen/teichoic acid export membrane protein